MLEAYLEAGMIGLVAVLFAGQLIFLQKTLMSKLSEIEQITIKLIDRWNRSDEISQRHREDIIKEMNDITDDLNFVKGRLNGRAG